MCGGTILWEMNKYGVFFGDFAEQVYKKSLHENFQAIACWPEMNRKAKATSNHIQ